MSLVFVTIFLQQRRHKVVSTKWKVLQDILPELVNHVQKINIQLIYCFKDWFHHYYAHSYSTCWGYPNIPQEWTNSSLLQTNNFPNAKTYVNGIQLLRKKYQYTFRLHIYNIKKNYMKNTAFPYGKKKSQENHPEYSATISAPSKSISSNSRHAIS